MAEAYTVAARRRRKVGRPAKKSVRRYPDGSVHRHATKATEAETLAVVCDARIRHGLAISRDDARDPRIATALGRAFRAGIIDKREHDAGELYASQYRRAASLLGIPNPLKGAKDGTGPTPEEIRDDEADAIKRRFMEANGALGNAGGGAWREVREVAVFGTDCGSEALLRFGLKALALYYRMPVDVEEKAA
jgi:hypothetical protein